MSFRSLFFIGCRLALLAMVIASVGCASKTLQGRNQDLVVFSEQYCWDTLRNAKGNATRLSPMLDRETELFQAMMEDLLASRAQTMQLPRKLKVEMKKEGPMPPGLQNTMKERMRKGFRKTGI